MQYTYLADADAYEVSGIGTCTDLKVYIPDTYEGKPVISIGNRAFYYSSIQEIVLGDNVERIEEWAFYYADQMMCFSISENSNLKFIGSHAFYECTSLLSFTLPETVERIEDWAFSYANKMIYFYVSDNSHLKFIGEHAFSGCTSLLSFTLPETIETISRAAFFGCYKLLVVNNNSNITLNLGKIDSHYLAYYAKEIINDGTISSKMGIEGDYVYFQNGTTTYLVAYLGNSTILQLPETLNNSQYHIYKYGLSNINITHLVFSKGVLGIEEYAFDNSKVNLAAISVASDNTVFKADMNCLIQISNNALIMGCNNSLIPNYVTRIEDYAFKGCNLIESVTIPNTVTYLGSGAFANCKNLKNVTFAEGINLKVIENSAFNGCASLVEISIPDSVEEIDDSAFDWCYTLEKVNFSENSKLKVIGYCTFRSCSKMIEFKIPKSVTTIDGFAFSSCSILETILISNNVTSVGTWAFYGCKVLTIYAEANEQPSGWDDDWNPSDRPVVWGYTL